MNLVRKHTSLIIFGLGGYLKASPVGEVLDNESKYVVIGDCVQSARCHFVHFANDRDTRSRPVDDESKQERQIEHSHSSAVEYPLMPE